MLNSLLAAYTGYNILTLKQANNIRDSN